MCQGGGSGGEKGVRRALGENLQTSNSITIWIRGRVIRNRLGNASSIHIYCQKSLAKTGIGGVDGIHIIYCTNKCGHVDLIEI